MEIVPLESIPKQTEKVPASDLVGILKICHQMEELCRKSNGAGLSAVQVGLPWKLFVGRKEGNSSDFQYLLNCSYEPVGEERIISHEGCLSLRMKDDSLRTFRVERYKAVRVTGQRLTSSGKLELVDVDMVAEDWWATMYQHEIDHQNGILISDIGQEIGIHMRRG